MSNKSNNSALKARLSMPNRKAKIEKNNTINLFIYHKNNEKNQKDNNHVLEEPKMGM